MFTIVIERPTSSFFTPIIFCVEAIAELPQMAFPIPIRSANFLFILNSFPKIRDIELVTTIPVKIINITFIPSSDITK